MKGKKNNPPATQTFNKVQKEEIQK